MGKWPSYSYSVAGCCGLSTGSTIRIPTDRHAVLHLRSYRYAGPYRQRYVITIGVCYTYIA